MSMWPEQGAMMVIKKFLGNAQGSSVVEFALLALPFMMVLISIFEMALMFFVDSGLDASLHKTARNIRTGNALSEGWDIARFKGELCRDLAFSPGCSHDLLVRSVRIAALDGVQYATPISGGRLSVREEFTLGDSGDYMLVQVFLPWDPILSFHSLSSRKLANDTGVLGATVLFKNEPY